MRRWIAVICLLGAIAMTAPSPVRAGDPATRVQQQTLRDRIQDPTGRALYDSLRRLPHMEVVFAEFDKAPEDQITRFAFGYPGGDLNRDSRGDVLAVDYSIGLAGAVDSKVRFHAVSGRTGTRLFMFEREKVNGLLGAIPARLGKRGHPGVLVFEIEGIFGPLEDRRFLLLALNGKGKKIWEREYTGTFVDAYPVYFGYNVPVSLDMFNGLKGRQTDFLVTLADSVQAGTTVATSHARVVHGSDGREKVHPGREIGLGVVPETWATGNLGGNRLDDYVFVNLDRRRGEEVTTLEPTGLLRARTGTDGEPLWESDGFPWGGPIWIYPMKDIRGNGREEIAVTVGDNEQQDPFLPIYLDTGKPGFHWKLRFFDGSDGFALWAARGGWPHAIGDANGDGVTDITSYDLAFGDDNVKVTVRTTGGYGERVWRKVFTTRAPPARLSSSIGSGFGAAGDLHPDGTSDLFVRHSMEADNLVEKTVIFTVDGRRGRRMRTGGEELYPLRRAVDGRGADVLVARRDSNGHFMLKAQSGAGGRTLWHARVEANIPVAAISASFWPQAMSLDGDRCSDILFSSQVTTSGFVTALNGGDGSTHWSYTLWGSERTSSTVLQDRNKVC